MCFSYSIFVTNIGIYYDSWVIFKIKKFDSLFYMLRMLVANCYIYNSLSVCGEPDIELFAQIYTFL